MSGPNALRIATAVITAGCFLLVAAVALSGQALTYAPHPSASPQEIAERAESLSGEGSFSDRHDGAMFGRGASHRENCDGESADYGKSEVVVDVIGMYGTPVSGPAVILQDDTGWVIRFPIGAGTHYSIPDVETTDGLYLHLFDPIAVVAESDVERLTGVAEAHAWGVVSQSDSDGPFGVASASVDSSGSDEILVQIEVEVAGDPATVAARFMWDSHELVIPLQDQGAGVFGATTRFELVKDYTVVFEAIGEETFASDPMSLTELGAVVESAPGAVDAGERAARPFNRWLTLGLGLTALSILALLVVRSGAGNSGEPAE